MATVVNHADGTWSWASPADMPLVRPKHVWVPPADKPREVSPRVEESPRVDNARSRRAKRNGWRGVS